MPVCAKPASAAVIAPDSVAWFAVGLALVPSTLQAIALPGVVFRQLDETDTTTTLYIVHRRGDANARAMQFVALAHGLRQVATKAAHSAQA